MNLNKLKSVGHTNSLLDRLGGKKASSSNRDQGVNRQTSSFLISRKEIDTFPDLYQWCDNCKTETSQYRVRPKPLCTRCEVN